MTLIVTFFACCLTSFFGLYGILARGETISTEMYVIYGLAVILTTVGLIKSPTKTKLGLNKGLNSFLNLMPILLPMFLSSHRI